MAPIVLKIKEGELFSDLDEEDLSKTWRVCTKVKDSLENGSRLENLSWRLWFLQNVSKEAKSNKPVTAETTTTEYYPTQEQETPESILNYSLDDIKLTNNFTLNQFTSDQDIDQIIELQDIFPIDFMFPEEEDPHQLIPCTPTDNYSFGFAYDNQIMTNDPSYVTNVSQQPLTYDYFMPTNATLHNKILTTVPKQTLERLLMMPEQQQHYYNTFQVMDSTPTLPPPPQPEDKPTVCSNCEATSTPLWRRSDDKILCNACGLYLKLHNMPRPKHLKPSQGKVNNELEPNNKSEIAKTTCSNCGTSKTPLWRRDTEGSPLCNACGLYLKLHNAKRPLSMKTDIIKKRQRTEALLANDQIKKPKYFDHLSLHAKASASSLPGTGILMMSGQQHSHC